MLAETVVELSRWQFALSALCHWLFIPLSLGLSVLLATAESLAYLSACTTYQNMARVWGRLFAISCVLAVATRLPLLLQLGSNTSYFAHYAGDIFALPLAIEALSGFFVSAALFSAIWLGREQLSRNAHLLLTWLLVISLHIAAFWLVSAAAWLQNPLATAFNISSYRMELINVQQLLDNPIITSKFIHSVAASHISAMTVVVAISSFWLQSNRNDLLASHSFKLASILGLIASIAIVAVPDTTPHHANAVQNAKLGAISGADNAALLPDIEARIRNGIAAFDLLQQLRDNNANPQLLPAFNQQQADLGYALLLTPWTKQISDAKPAQIKLAAQSALPTHPNIIYWAYRLMLACGGLSLLGFSVLSWQALRQSAMTDWLLKLGLYLLPWPWLASMAGWLVSILGLQPWSIAGVLPTVLSTSSLTNKELLISLAGYGLVYAALFTVVVYLLKRIINQPLGAAS